MQDPNQKTNKNKVGTHCAKLQVINQCYDLSQISASLQLITLWPKNEAQYKQLINSRVIKFLHPSYVNQSQQTYLKHYHLKRKKMYLNWKVNWKVIIMIYLKFINRLIRRKFIVQKVNHLKMYQIWSKVKTLTALLFIQLIYMKAKINIKKVISKINKLNITSQRKYHFKLI